MTMDTPVYYRISDPIQNLRLKIKLTRVTKTFQREADVQAHGISEGKQAEKDPEDEEDNSSDDSVADTDAFLGKQRSQEDQFGSDDSRNTWESNFTWQEKVFGPREILMYRPGGVSGEEAHEGDVLGQTAIEMEYREELKRKSLFGAKLLKDSYPVCLFTYTDKDGFVPLNQIRKYSTTSDDFSLNPVAKSIVTLPQLGMQLGEKKNGNSFGNNSYGIGQRMLRESPSKVYYVMAAVDVNPSSFTSRGVKIPEFYEVVLCTIRTERDSNMVEMRPGLSTPSAHLADAAIDSLNKLQKYTFRTPSGSVYEYTIENEAECLDEMAENELAAVEREHSQRLLMEQEARIGNQLLGCSTNPLETRFNCFVEIVSAFDFDSYSDCWYVQYEVVLPPSSNWKWASTMTTSAKEQNSNIASYVAGLGAGTNPAEVDEQSAKQKNNQRAIMKGVTQSACVRDITPQSIETTGASRAGRIAHFAFPLHLEFQHTAVDDPQDILNGKQFPLAQMPQVFFQVKSRDILERHRVEGYGYIDIPSTPGSFDMNIRTWKPRGSIRQRTQDFLIGGSLQLDSSMYTAISQASSTGSFLNRFGFSTETSGTLRVRIHSVAQRYLDQSAIRAASTKSKPTGTTRKTKRTVEDILNSLKLGHLARRGKQGDLGGSEAADLLASVARVRREKENAKLREEMNQERDQDDREREERESRLARLQARITAKRNAAAESGESR